MNPLPAPVEPPVGGNSPVRYEAGGPVEWRIDSDIMLLSYIYVGKDGVGGFNDVIRLSWEQICEQMRANMSLGGDFSNYNPNELQRRWEEDLREFIRVSAENYWSNNVWGVNEGVVSTDVRILRDLIHHSFVGGLCPLDPPLTWEEIAEAMNLARVNFDNNFNGYDAKFISEFYYYNLAPRLLVIQREGVPDDQLQPRFKAPFPRIAYPEFLGEADMEGQN